MIQREYVFYGDDETSKQLLSKEEEKIHHEMKEFQIVQTKTKKRQCLDKDIVLSVTSLILSLIALWGNFLR